MKRIGGWMLAAALMVQSSAARALEFDGTARLQLERVLTLEGDDKGPGRIAFETLLASCNGIRSGFYELPAQGIAADVMARVDRQRVDHYFSNDRAATYVTGTLLELPDLQRWTTQSANSATGKVEVPPDCARVSEHEQRTATIWREGVVWRVDFSARRALGTRRPGDFTPKALPLPKPFESLPTQLIVGAPCREVVAPAIGFLDGRACLWSVFPAAKFLGFPWPLRAETRLGSPRKMVQVDRAVLAERNGVLDPGLFDIPSGFSRVGPAP